MPNVGACALCPRLDPGLGFGLACSVLVLGRPDFCQSQWHSRWVLVWWLTGSSYIWLTGLGYSAGEECELLALIPFGCPDLGCQSPLGAAKLLRRVANNLIAVLLTHDCSHSCTVENST